MNSRSACRRRAACRHTASLPCRSSCRMSRTAASRVHFRCTRSTSCSRRPSGNSSMARRWSSRTSSASIGRTPSGVCRWCWPGGPCTVRGSGRTRRTYTAGRSRRTPSRPGSASAPGRPECTCSTSSSRRGRRIEHRALRRRNQTARSGCTGRRRLVLWSSSLPWSL